MRISAAHPGVLRNLVALATLGAVVGVAGGCSDSSNNNNGGATTTTFSGTFQGGTTNNESGSIAVTISSGTLAPPALSSGMMLAATPPGDVTATAVVKVVAPAASNHNLSGTYNTSSDALDVSETGGYAFQGGFSGGTRFEGTYTGPNGPGTFEGETGSGAKAYCGTFASSVGGGDGFFNITINGTTVHGNALDSSDPVAIPLDGVIVGADSISIDNPQAPGNQLAGGRRYVAQDSVAGTYNTGGGDNGTWSGKGC